VPISGKSVDFNQKNTQNTYTGTFVPNYNFKEYLMRTQSKVMLWGGIIALILALPLAAQSYDNNVLGSAPALTSNTKAATATIFTTDVDNFINYHKYGSVLKDDNRWFGFITGAPYTVGSNSPTGKLSAGYARTLGSVYLGAWYQGNIYQNTSLSGGDKTVTMTSTYDDDSRKLAQTTKTTQYNPGWVNNTNQIEFLIGVAGQGIKLGFVESLYSNEHEHSTNRDETITNNQDGSIDYTGVTDEYTASGGTLKPYLGWGTNLAIGGANLMPYIDVSLDIFSDTLVDNYRNYSTFNGKKTSETTSVGKGNNTGYLRPVGTVGAKLDLAKKETIQTTLELKYKIDMKLYSSDYDATGLSGTVDGDVSWDEGYVNRKSRYIDRTVTSTDLTLKIAEKTDISHSVTPIYKITGEPTSGFRVGFSAQIPLSYQLTTNNQYSDTYTITDTKYNAGGVGSTRTTTLAHTPGDNTETSNLSARIDVNLGASYKLIPDRFTINAGIKATPTIFTHTETKKSANSVGSVTTSTTVDNLGNVTNNTVDVTSAAGVDKLEVTNTWAGYSGTLTGGFLFYFTPKAALDMGLSASTNSFTIDLADVNVLFSIKF